MKFARQTAAALIALAALSLLSACDRTTPPASSTNPPAQPNRASPAAAATQQEPAKLDTLGYVRGQQPTSPTAALPPGHPPLDAASPSAAPPMPASEPGEGELQYTAPATWAVQPPANRMRLAQFSIPRADGDPEDGLVTLSRVGGPVEMNVARWRGMFKTADGQPVATEAIKQESFEVNGLKVTVVDMTGRYADAMTRGDASPTATDFRLLGGVVEHATGNWYFKCTGPAPTMAQQAAAFTEMMKSVKVK